MGSRLLGAFVRAVAWNVALGATIGVGTFFGILGANAPEAGDAGGAAVFALVGTPFAMLVGASLGLRAGLVHGVAQVTVALARPARARLVARCVATPLSAALAAYALARADDPGWLAVPLVLYVPLTAWVAAWGYEDASTAAALSAARRNGASSASRVSGSASDSSRATSE
ncbi:MAG TPA: hypothetical protein VGX28_10555 [Frankiaceae bacterium]|jgi:hypothetical protein|nr:hypothetical protein [Frankiaceae bacterium]